MRARAWLLLLGMAAPVTAAAVTPEDFKILTAQDVVDVCSVSKDDPYYTAAINFCQGYAVGTYDVYDALMARPGAKPFVCLPDPPPPRSQTIADFVAWMNANPKYGGEFPSNAIFKFLAEKFPCASQSAGSAPKEGAK